MLLFVLFTIEKDFLLLCEIIRRGCEMSIVREILLDDVLHAVINVLWCLLFSF